MNMFEAIAKLSEELKKDGLKPTSKNIDKKFKELFGITFKKWCSDNKGVAK